MPMDDLLMNPWSSPATNFRPDRDECTIVSPLDSAFYEGEPPVFFQQPSIQADPLLARLARDPYLSNSMPVSQPQEFLAADGEAAAPGFNWTTCSLDVLPDLQVESEFMFHEEAPSSLTDTSLQGTTFNLGSSASSQCGFLDEKKAPPAATSSYDCVLGPPSKLQRTSLCEQASGIQAQAKLAMAELQQQPLPRDPCIVEAAVEPQSVAARQRRKRISERVRSLEKLIPGGAKMDTATMLDEAIRYVKFLQMQVRVLEQLGETAPPSSAGSCPLVLSEELQEVLFRKRCLVASARQCNSTL